MRKRPKMIDPFLIKKRKNSNRTHDQRKLIIIFVFKKGRKTKQERELRRRETSVIHDRIDNNTCQPNRVCEVACVTNRSCNLKAVNKPEYWKDITHDDRIETSYSIL